MKNLFNSKSLSCGILMLSMVGVAFYQSFTCFTCGNNLSHLSNDVKIMDNGNFEVHCNNAGICNDIAITKTAVNGGYNYTVSNCKTNEKLCDFNAKEEISLEDGTVVKSETLCAAVYALADALKKNNGNLELALRALCQGGGAVAAIAANPTFQAAGALLAEGASVSAVMSVLSGWEVFVLGGGIAAVA